MPLLHIPGDTKQRAFGAVDPAGREEAGEGNHENNAAVVGDGLGRAL
jgi:hypothetical protein